MPGFCLIAAKAGIGPDRAEVRNDPGCVKTQKSKRGEER